MKRDKMLSSILLPKLGFAHHVYVTLLVPIILMVHCGASALDQ